MLARWHRQAGDDTWLLTGTDEHGQKILRTAVANDMTPAGVGRPPGRIGLEAAARRRSTSRTTTSSARPTSGTRPASRSSSSSSTTTATSTTASTRATTASAARSTSSSTTSWRRRTATTRARSSARSTRRPVEILKEKNYFFRMSDVRGAAARALRDAARLHPARERAQRDHAVREAGARRPVDLALDVRLGRQGAVGRLARHLRLVRRAAQLHHRDRLRRPDDRRVRAAAGRRPPRRQGHRPLPRRHLARHADGGRAAGAARASSATAGCWSAARRCRSRS